MKLKQLLPQQPPLSRQLYIAVSGFRKAATRLRQVVLANPVASEEEKEDVKKLMKDAFTTFEKIQKRTEKVLRENSELYKMDDIEIGVKWDSQGQDIPYMVEIATTMLSRMHQLRHIGEDEYLTLRRFWLQVPVEHQRLVGMWDKATNTTTKPSVG